MAKSRSFFFFAILFFVLALAILFFIIVNGYQIDLAKRTIKQGGILAATSFPNGAQIYIDDKLVSATDTTINLNPGQYEILIKKPGFSDWQKKILIEKGLVTKTDAYLFAGTPDLKAITFISITTAALSPDGSRLVFGAKAFPDSSYGGVWIMDLTDRPFGLSREPWQIYENQANGRDFSKAEYSWSPDSKETLVIFKREVKKGKPTIESAFLLQADRINKAVELLDISPTLQSTLALWQKESQKRIAVQLSKLPAALLDEFEKSVDGVKFSPDETKILYTATASAAIAENLLPHPPGRNTQPEDRQIRPGKIYVLDLKEDKNFYITDKAETKKLSWVGNSRHLFWLEKGKIKIGEYDNTNWVSTYTGAFIDFNAFPFPSGNKILILTNLGQKDAPANLYEVILR